MKVAYVVFGRVHYIMTTIKVMRKNESDFLRLPFRESNNSSLLKNISFPLSNSVALQVYSSWTSQSKNSKIPMSNRPILSVIWIDDASITKYTFWNIVSSYFKDCNRALLDCTLTIIYTDWPYHRFWIAFRTPHNLISTKLIWLIQLWR